MITLVTKYNYKRNMKSEEHEKAYTEHLKNIDNAIENGIEDNQRNLGFNISQGSVELFAIYLHKLNLIQGPGDQFDHRIFKNKSLMSKKIPPNFPEKKEILELMEKIETEKNVICYGKRKPKEKIELLLKNFQNLRKIINKNLKNVGKK